MPRWRCASAFVGRAAQEPRSRFERPSRRRRAAPSRLAVDVTLLAGGRAVPRDPARRDGRSPKAACTTFGCSMRPAGRVPYLLVQRRSEPGWRDRPDPAYRRDQDHQRIRGRLRGSRRDRPRASVDGISAPFLKRLTLEGSGDRARWTLLQSEGHAVRSAGRADLEPRICRSRRARYRYVRVTWNDANSGRVPLPARVWRASDGCASGRSRDVDRPRRSSGARVSRAAAGIGFRCRRAAADRRAGSSTSRPATCFAQASVSESRFAGTEAAPVVLGSGTLVRVLRAGASAESLRVTIAPPAEAELDLIVEDGNNPPLDLRKVSARLRRAALDLFRGARRQPSSRAMAIAWRRAPTYDLEAARAVDRSRPHTEARWVLRALRRLPARPSGPAPPISAGAALEGDFRYPRPVAGADHGRAGGAAARRRRAESQPGALSALRRRPDRRTPSRQADPVPARAPRRAAVPST